MSLKLLESGKTLRVSSGELVGGVITSAFDMSSNTELTLTFTKPSGSTSTKTKSGGEVVLGASNVTEADLGAILASEYVEYEIEAGFLTPAGTWKVYLTYTNTSATPDDVYYGDCAEFEVEGICA